MILHNFEPLPKDLRGWNGDHPIFSQLVKVTKPKVIIEVGSWKGQSTASLANASRKYCSTVYAIDTWLGAYEFRQNKEMFGDDWDLMLKHGYPQVYYQFLSNMVHEGVIDMIEPIPAIAKDAVPYVPVAQLIYIDAGHTYEDAKSDIENYWTKLEVGGIMFGDDYTLKLAGPREGDGYNPEVYKAVDEFVKKHELSLQVVDHNYWVIKKTK